MVANLEIDDMIFRGWSQEGLDDKGKGGIKSGKKSDDVINGRCLIICLRFHQCHELFLAFHNLFMMLLHMKVNPKYHLLFMSSI